MIFINKYAVIITLVI